MGSYEHLALTALAAAAIASLLAYRAAATNLHRAPWLRSIGRRLHKQKMAGLEKAPLSHYRRLVEHGAMFRAFLFIATGILLKSAVSGALGLIVIFYLPLGVGVIPAMAAAHGDTPEMQRWVAQVTFLQTASHLLAAALGFAVGWLWISTGVGPTDTLAAAPGFTLLLLAASVLTGLLAAWKEAAGHVRRNFLE